MRSTLLRMAAFALVSSVILPILAGCGKTEKAMETPSGLSPRQQREQQKGTPQ